MFDLFISLNKRKERGIYIDNVGKMFAIHPSCNTDRGVFCMCKYVVIIRKTVYVVKANKNKICGKSKIKKKVEITITQINVNKRLIMR